eukprot:3330504-Prymnesium_polylepis.2
MVGEGVDAAEACMAMAAAETAETVVMEMETVVVEMVEMEEEMVAAVTVEPVITVAVLTEEPVKTVAVARVGRTDSTRPRSSPRRAGSSGPSHNHSSRWRVAHPPMRPQQAGTRQCGLAADP